MQIVIELDKEDYEKIKKTSFVENTETMLNQSSEDRKGTMMLFRVIDAIENGTPLPEGCDVQRIIPKRVDVQKWMYTECPNPNCNHKLSVHYGDGYYVFEHQPDFCPDCGQALLWESEVQDAESY